MGCGKRDFGPGWHNVDMDHYPHIDSSDIWLEDFMPHSIDLLYASHFLEYFNPLVAEGLLSTWKEKLRPGGTLRLAVPDFEAICNLYKNGYSLQTFLGPIYGHWLSPVGSIQHATMYDYRTLSSLLVSCGYKNVHRYNWRHTEHAQFDDHSQAYIPHMDKEHGILISLNVEATA